MRIVIVNMKDYIFADAVAQSLQADKKSDFVVQKATSSKEIIQYCRLCDPYAVIMETTASSPYLPEERLKIRDEIKKISPDCKVVLVVDENSDKEVAKKVRQAKKDSIIDQFIYGSVSASYMVALMDTL